MNKIFLILGLAMAGCSQERAATLHSDIGQKLSNVAPMTATGPTRELFVLFRTVEFLSPDLMDVIVKTRSLQEGFRFRLNILVDPAELSAAKNWLATRIDLQDLEVRWIATEGQGILPGNTYVQDSFNFFWDDAERKMRLLAPNQPKHINAYSQMGSAIGIPIETIAAASSNEYEVQRSMAGYAAGGNWEFLPGKVVVGLAPALPEKFIQQVSSRLGDEFDHFYNEEYSFLASDEPDLSAEEVRKKTLEKVTSDAFMNPMKYESVHAMETHTLFGRYGYDVLSIDSYTPFKQKLTEVDHIDEHFAAFRSLEGGNCQIGLLVPNPLEAWDILQRESKPRTDEEKMLCEKLADKVYDNYKAIAAIADEINTARSNGCFPLLGLTDDALVSAIPRDSAEKDYNQIKYTVEQVVRKLAENGCDNPLIVEVPSQLQINIANSLILTPDNGSSVVIRPDSYYEPFERAIEASLNKHNVKSYKANSLALATGKGNLHCATNTITDGYSLEK